MSQRDASDLMYVLSKTLKRAHFFKCKSNNSMGYGMAYVYFCPLNENAEVNQCIGASLQLHQYQIF